MSIFSIEAAESFGALDWDAMADGVQVDANACRTIGRQANRLLKKRHQILSLVWPVTVATIEDLSQRQQESIITPAWGLMLPPAAVLKKPGLTSATIYLRALVPSSRTVYVRVGTLAKDVETEQQITIAGTGSFAWYSGTITLDVGDREEIRLYGRSADQGALMNTATYGTPNSGLLSGVNLLETSMTLGSGSHSIDEDAVLDGHYIRFFHGFWPAADRRLTGVFTGAGDHVLYFDALDTSTVNNLRLAARTGGSSFEIRQLPNISLAQVLVVTDERAF